MKRIISLFCCFAIISSFFVVPVSANYTSQARNLWDAYLLQGVATSTGVPFLDGILTGVAGWLSGAICSSSEDKLHHADVIETYGTDKDGTPFAFCRCKYCREGFKAYSSDFAAAYDTYVTDLPATGLGSDGYFYWYPKFSYGYIQDKSTTADVKFWFGNTENRNTLTYFNSSVLYGSPMVVSSEYAYSGSASRFRMLACLAYEDVAPISGIYEYDSTKDYNLPCWGRYVTKTGDVYSFRNEPSSNPNITKVHYSAGSSVSFEPSFMMSYWYDLVSFQIEFGSFLVKIQPSSGLIDPVGDTTYNINSRPASITGDYGIIGDNGTIIKSDTQYIINETNNTYTNPATGTTETITNWTYDYSDRSYNVITESGDTITITYGDENITINEGDTVYNIYYVTEVPEDGGGDIPSSPPPACNHSYTSTTTTVPTCEAPGLETLTCSKCGHSYTQKLPATGHTWTIKQTVATEYDESGNIIQQGYTIYKCSVCSTEYKDDAGTGPPNNSVDNGGGGLWDKLGNLIGTVGDGILSLIDAVVGKLLDGLISLAEMISGKLKQIVDLILSWFEELPALFTGFLDFLTASFSFMPDEVVLLLTFGIAAVVFIGIIKALRR